MKKAIIFDVDGTLADTERDGHRPAFNEAFKKEGLNWNWDEDLYGKLLQVAGGKERIQYFINEFLPKEERPADAVAIAKKLHLIKTEIYVNSLNNGKIPLRKGIRRLINEAKERGLIIAIATTTTPDNITALLDGTLGRGSINWFAAVGDGENSPIKKPDPQVYHYVLNKLGLKPEECIAIEDTEMGLKASTDSRIETVITVNEYTKDQNFQGAKLVLSDIGEPNEPFRLLAGNVCNHSFFSVDLIQDCWK